MKLTFVLSLVLFCAAALPAQPRADPVPGQEAPPPPRAEGLASGEIVIRPAAKPAPERQRAMERWHRTYREQMEPVDRALAGLEEATLRTRPPAWLPHCRRLGRALADLDREKVFPAPEYSVHSHLETTLGYLQRTAVACLEKRWTAVPHQMRKAAGARSQAALSLRRFGLEP